MTGILAQVAQGFEEFEGEIPALLGGAMLVVWLVGFYLYPALCLHLIAKKTNTSPAWLAWIPIANVILMLMVAEKPIWWIVLLFIPIIQIVWIILGILVWMAIAEKRGKSAVWGVLMIIPLFNFIALGYLAFSK